MRRQVLVYFVLFFVVGLVGTRAESAPARYTQEVDNAAGDRFEADEGWGESSYGREVQGEDYRFARPGGGEVFARFKVKTPEEAKYAVYARWPEVEGLNGSAPIGVETASGDVEWTRVDQRRDGGRWVRVGVYEMEAGDDYSVFFSNQTDDEGYVAADAVRLVQVSRGKEEVSERVRRDRTGDDGRRSASEEREGREVVEEAKEYMGTRYRLGRASRSRIDCSGLTMMVYRKFGVNLPHYDKKQYRYGEKVKGEPKAGDLVFFDEHDKGISHVGIATGRNGTMIHASSYFGKVVESRIRDVEGYEGARRLL